VRLKTLRAPTARGAFYIEIVKTRVLLFASYADAFGAPSLDVDLPVGATLRELLAHVRALAAGKALPPSPLIAVNQAYASLETIIAADDEVALIPPVAGG
jgi:molybdopterin converting factor small subunit